MNTRALNELALRWREEAALLRSRGADGHAVLEEGLANELEQKLREWQLEELTIEEAADESGYSYKRLQELVSLGEIDNAGKRGSPRIRRRDLPSKAGQGREEEPSPAVVALKARRRE